MSVIKVQDVEYVKFTAPDLACMRAFLLDFGLRDAEVGSSQDVLRMRGTGDAPFVHETQSGPPGFAGLALRARSVEDLETLAKFERTRVEVLRGPEQGWVVRLIDPNGFNVEVIAGPPRRLAVPGPDSVCDWNTSLRKARSNSAKRIPKGPASVLRLGHIVLIVNDVGNTCRWWQERFGLLMSDEVRAPNGELAAVFIRCDRGSDPADHHSLNFAQVPNRRAAFHHAAFEVAGFDDLMAGHERLRDRGYAHRWGIGRHILGSQVFDYWSDPWGNIVEHWTDGDFLAADVPATVTDLQTMLGRQWGPEAPADFV